MAYTWIQSFGNFIVAVFLQYVLLASGGVLTVLILLIERHWLKRQISYKTELGVLALFVFLACFRAWKHEHETLETLKNTSAPKNIVANNTSVTTSASSYRKPFSTADRIPDSVVAARVTALAAQMREIEATYKRSSDIPPGVNFGESERMLSAAMQAEQNSWAPLRPQAIVLRNELLTRVPKAKQPHSPLNEVDMVLDKGALAGPNPLSDVATYLEQLSYLLTSRDGGN